MLRLLYLAIYTIAIFVGCGADLKSEVYADQNVIYASDSDTAGRNIWARSLITGETRRVTKNDLFENNPALSPDGQRVVFSRGKSEKDAETWEIFVSNLDGTGEQQVTRNTFVDGHPDWTADGKSIVFATYRGNGEGADIYLVKADGSGERPLISTPYDDNDPEPSPNGRYLAFKSTSFTRQPERTDIFISDMQGGNIRRLTDGGHSDHDPSWSPNSNFLTFMRYEGPGIWTDISTSIREPWNIFSLTLEGKEAKLTDCDGTPYCWLPVFISDSEIAFLESEASFFGPVLTGLRTDIVKMTLGENPSRSLLLNAEEGPEIWYFDLSTSQ